MKNLIEAESILRHKIVVCRDPKVIVPIPDPPRSVWEEQARALGVSFRTETVDIEDSRLLIRLDSDEQFLLAWCEPFNAFIAWAVGPLLRYRFPGMRAEYMW